MSMFKHTRNLVLATGVSALALAGSAFASEDLKFSDIDVDTSYSAAQDSNAAAMYPQFAEDLHKAIAERVPTSTDAADPEIHVDIRKIALDGDTYLPDSKEFNEMEGILSVNSTDSGVSGRNIIINLTAYSAEVPAPEGVIMLPPSTGDFYAAMVNGFADVVAEKLADDLYTEGDQKSN